MGTPCTDDAGKSKCVGFPPIPIAENADVWETYELASTQWRTGFGGRESLDLKAVFPIAQQMGITLDELDIRKLNLISYLIVSDDITRMEAKK